jgi:uncharacterized protein YoxC
MKKEETLKGIIVIMVCVILMLIINTHRLSNAVDELEFQLFEIELELDVHKAYNDKLLNQIDDLYIMLTHITNQRDFLNVEVSRLHGRPVR